MCGQASVAELADNEQGGYAHLRETLPKVPTWVMRDSLEMVRNPVTNHLQMKYTGTRVKYTPGVNIIATSSRRHSGSDILGSDDPRDPTTILWPVLP